MVKIMSKFWNQRPATRLNEIQVNVIADMLEFHLEQLWQESLKSHPSNPRQAVNTIYNCLTMACDQNTNKERRQSRSEIDKTKTLSNLIRGESSALQSIKIQEFSEHSLEALQPDAQFLGTNIMKKFLEDIDQIRSASNMTDDNLKNNIKHAMTKVSSGEGSYVESLCHMDNIQQPKASREPLSITNPLLTINDRHANAELESAVNAVNANRDSCFSSCTKALRQFINNISR